MNIGIGITLHIDNDTHTLTARLIVDVGDAIQLCLPWQGQQ
jgi:hypothetical protein